MKITISLEGDEFKRVLTGTHNKHVADHVGTRVFKNILDGYEVEVLIPAKVLAVSPSFMEALIRPVFGYLGKAQFMEKVTIRSEGSLDLAPDLDEAMTRIQREGNVHICAMEASEWAQIINEVTEFSLLELLAIQMFDMGYTSEKYQSGMKGDIGSGIVKNNLYVALRDIENGVLKVNKLRKAASSLKIK